MLTVFKFPFLASLILVLHPIVDIWIGRKQPRATGLSPHWAKPY